MKKILSHTIAIAIAILTANACSGNKIERGEGALDISLNPEEIVVSSYGDTKTVNVTANGEWTLSGTTSWCFASPLSGESGTTSIIITVNERVDTEQGCYEDRTALLTIGNKTIVVTQKKIGSIVISKSKHEVPIEGGVIDIIVDHNVEFADEIREDGIAWVEKVKTKSFQQTQLKYDIKAYEGETPRSTEIYIKDTADPQVVDTIKIFQAKTNSLILTNPVQRIPSSGNNNLTIELRTNTDFDIVMPVGELWIRRAPGTNTEVRSDQLKLIVDPMEETDCDNRYAEIIVKDKHSAIADTLKVTQIAKNSIFLSQSVFERDFNYSVISVEVNPNFNNYDVVILNEEWISELEQSIENTSGSKQGKHSFAIFQNPGVNDRIGRIAFKDKTEAVSDTVKVIQSGNPSGLAPKEDRAMIAVFNGRNDRSANLGVKTVLVSWRYLPTDPVDVAFDLWRSVDGQSPKKINTTPINKGTNFQDPTADLSKTNKYFLRLSGGEENIAEYEYTAAMSAKPYFSIPLQPLAPVEGVVYEVHDGAIGDLDGDGNYEILVIREAETRDPGAGSTPAKGTAKVEAYRLDGTFMWRVDLGVNIMPGSHTVMMVVYDFDNDGKAEVALRTSEGTTFGDGRQIGDNNGDGKTDYRRAVDGFIVEGPEFLSVIDGVTGAERARTNYIPRGEISDWWTPGKTDTGNRSMRYMMGVGHFGGTKPSILICRGVYAKTVLEAWDYNGTSLKKRWNFTAVPGGQNSTYTGQGGHTLAVGDVDSDGKDEVIYGACTIDHDGTGLYSSKLGHGDALHFGKFEKKRSGFQIFMTHEESPFGISYRDASTGAILFRKAGTRDTGRGVIANINPDVNGYVMWSSDETDRMYSTDGATIMREIPKSAGSSWNYNMAIWWTGSLNRQTLDRTLISCLEPNTTTGTKRLRTFSYWGAKEMPGSKSAPVFYGDILGDWREEVIYQKDGTYDELLVFTTDYPCDYKIHPLMTDHIYRLSAAHQNIVYNHPTHTGFYIGPDMFD